MTTTPLPRWADLVVIPLVNIALAFLVVTVLLLAIQADPIQALRLLVFGAFGYAEGLGYTLYYATNYVFTGLAVAIAFHAGLFNIGGEGQAYLGGLGAGLMCLALDSVLPGAVLIPLAVLMAALFGAGWAAVPGALQAYRGSHIVITTIMFNFIAATVMVYLMVNVLIEPGQMSPQSRTFEAAGTIPYVHDVLAGLGIAVARSPLNLSILIAALACVGVWIFLWRTRWGYEIRTVGANETAAVYAGIDTRRIVVLAMAISGALAGMVGVNEIVGVNQRLLLNFVAGAGFTGIAVALMGRNHPVGIVLAALLFGALTQGGTELDFEMQTVTRELVIVIQGLVILFSGALTYMMRPYLERLFGLFAAKPKPAAAE